MEITGTVARIDPRKGTFTDEKDGREVSYDFDVVRVVAELDTFEVKVKDDKRALTEGLRRGDPVTFEVDIPKGTRFELVQRIDA